MTLIVNPHEYSSDIEIELISEERIPNVVTVKYTPYKPCQAMMHVTLHGEQISGGPFFLDIGEPVKGMQVHHLS